MSPIRTFLYLLFELLIVQTNITNINDINYLQSERQNDTNSNRSQKRDIAYLDGPL